VILVDSGPLITAAIVKQPHDRACIDQSAFIRALAQGDFVGTEILDVDYARVAELIERYDDLPLGTTDASVIAVDERLGVREVATLDRRHFTAVRPSHVDAFTLLPERHGSLTRTRPELVDLPTGRWPMWSRPADLAAAISGAAGHCDPSHRRSHSAWGRASV
jgi:hypothetical protein